MANASGVPISPVGKSNPQFTLSAAAINNEPVELDGEPASPEHHHHHSKADALEGLSPQEREKRARLMSERKEDPGVLVDIPQTPHAEEFEQAGAKVTDGRTPYQ
ncbi:hypothetical protein LTR91_015004 [Friedmanniomyces endolithicus]|uniref:Uncharacterized protein n=1 Tax=Friedmanniomyces endolithicus TaxID=329885 RepID=A0AAN6J8R8_9PEZI|nr:hypothetical protein LTR35_014972 [Friedmanniomyces endolithicus]KAK0285325.1 hypothetical protein LTS00_010954 [Friedmanniomyces endolithicus]KAK0309443.1 hypothetical protein LTR01_004550 [Friedmanniomyces endolithicus]KAK0321037.1 hypothetical protein LTR82_007954 [Friedmanniomyces endolithicus]KAK0833194.1 hypothetical protein LTR73_002282 [Friedmanniomyces endolithicus]